MSSRHLVAWALSLLACNPAAAQTPANPKSDPDRPTILLLADFRIVEGQFRRTDSGDIETLGQPGKPAYAAKEVLFTGDSRVAVEGYLRSRATDAPKPPTPKGDFHPKALEAYAARVQPLMTNLCADCHARPAATGFRLAPIPHGYADPEATAANLEAVLKLVNRADPQSSPLIRYAATRHGPQREAALSHANHPALSRLKLWALWLTLPPTAPEPRH